MDEKIAYIAYIVKLNNMYLYINFNDLFYEMYISKRHINNNQDVLEMTYSNDINDTYINFNLIDNYVFDDKTKQNVYDGVMINKYIQIYNKYHNIMMIILKYFKNIDCYHNKLYIVGLDIEIEIHFNIFLDYKLMQKFNLCYRIQDENIVFTNNIMEIVDICKKSYPSLLKDGINLYN